MEIKYVYVVVFLASAAIGSFLYSRKLRNRYASSVLSNTQIATLFLLAVLGALPLTFLVLQGYSVYLVIPIVLILYVRERLEPPSLAWRSFTSAGVAILYSQVALFSFFNGAL